MGCIQIHDTHVFIAGDKCATYATILHEVICAQKSKVFSPKTSRLMLQKEMFDAVG